MLNPRTLWQQWRNSARLTPRFTLRRRQLQEQQLQQQQPTAGNDDCDPCNDLNNQGGGGGQAQASLREHERHFRTSEPYETEQHSPLEPPPSPVPNECEHMITTTPQPIQCLTSSQESYEEGLTMYTLTPPASAPFPPIVSAKRLATDIRSKHHKKRRRGRRYRTCLTDQTNLLSASMEWQDHNVITTQSTNVYSYNTTDDESDVGDWKLDTTKLSPAERNRHYWQICYGMVTTTAATTAPLPSSWSAQRLPPTKSCLSSHKKRRRSSILPFDGAVNHPSPPALPMSSFSSTEPQQKHRTPVASGKKSVQFGALSAAEFQKDEPPASAMKHLEYEEARQRYSCCHDDDVSNREHDETERTKANSRILAAWESDFEDVEESATKRRRSSCMFDPLLMPSARDLNDDEDTSLDIDEVFEEDTGATAGNRSNIGFLDVDDDELVYRHNVHR